jgi:hypothetical protein
MPEGFDGTPYPPGTSGIGNDGGCGDCGIVPDEYECEDGYELVGAVTMENGPGSCTRPTYLDQL